LVENVDPSIFSNARPEAESHPAAKASGSIEERVARLETAVSQLYHFIPAELRPDLSTGALSRESGQSEVSDAASAEEPRAEERPGGAERAGAKTRKGKQG
jgi:hypothetical protein